MKNNNSHTFLLILAISVTMLVSGLYVYMYYVVNVSITRAAAARDIVFLERANSGREQNVKDLYERTKIDRESLPKFLIPADRVVEFIESIEALGPQADSRVSLSSIEDTPPGQVTDSVYGLAVANVEATGSWSSVMRTLSLAENFPYGVSIKNVRISTSIAEKGSRSWKVNFTVEVILAPVIPSNKIQ